MLGEYSAISEPLYLIERAIHTGQSEHIELHFNERSNSGDSIPNRFDWLADYWIATTDLVILKVNTQ